MIHDIIICLGRDESLIKSSLLKLIKKKEKDGYGFILNLTDIKDEFLLTNKKAFFIGIKDFVQTVKNLPSERFNIFVIQGLKKDSNKAKFLINTLTTLGDDNGATNKPRNKNIRNFKISRRK